MTDPLSQESPEWREALEKCASEQIHLINEVQSAAVLLAVDLDSGRIVRASGNAGVLFKNAAEILGTPAREHFSGESLEHVRKRAQAWTGRGPAAHEIETSEGKIYLGWVHELDGRLIIEIPVAQRPLERDWDWHQDVEQAKRRLENTESLQPCLEQAAREVRALTGFDRVMIYRFRADDSGEVVAEARRDDWEPYLGLRYPSADIPPQARALFLRNATRILVDIEAEPAGIHSANPEDPLDLSLSRYRQPAAVHVEYLRNMGVKGSFVSSIVLNGKLWGLVACHHGGAMDLSVEVQVRTATLLEHFSAHLSLLARQEALEWKLQRTHLANKVIQSITVTEEWLTAVMALADELLAALAACGMVVRFEGRSHRAGSVPPEEAIDEICRAVFENEKQALVAAERATHEFSLSADPGVHQGVLAAKLSHFRDDMVLFFRKEEVAEVRWGGEPGKGLEREGGSMRLRPRASFEAWVETVRGRSAQWQPHHCEMAESLATTLTDIVITAYYLRREFVGDAMARLRLSHEASTEPVLLADSRGSVVYANPAADRVLGRRYNSIRAMLTELSLDPEDELPARLHSLVVQGETVETRVRLGHLEGAERERTVTLASLHDAERVVGYVVHFRDGGKAAGAAPAGAGG